MLHLLDLTASSPLGPRQGDFLWTQWGESSRKESGHVDWLLAADRITLPFAPPPPNLGLNASSVPLCLGLLLSKKIMSLSVTSLFLPTLS